MKDRKLRASGTELKQSLISRQTDGMRGTFAHEAELELMWEQVAKRTNRELLNDGYTEEEKRV